MGVGSERRGLSWGVQSLMRRKQVDSDRGRDGRHQQQQLAKELSVLQLIAIGVGSTMGAGVYVLIGTVAREHSGPALTVSFLIAGIAAALSALCYAELASRCPSAGSAYHYAYVCVGEGIAWLIGWALILEYTVGASAVARGISPNLAIFFGGPGSLPFFLTRTEIPCLGIVVDPSAAILVLVVTWLLCVGIKESSFVQFIAMTINICVLLFVIIAGGYLGFKTGWTGYSVSDGYFPYGVNGMLAGSATIFVAYIGFDVVASTAEEVKNPQHDLPWGIGLAVSICCFFYMMVSVVVVGLVPYFAINPDTPISSAFASHGMHWAMYIVTTGATTALCSTLMGGILPQPRILMAMARDGLLPPFFSDVSKHSQVPVKSTIVTGICAASLAFTMDVSELAGMVSVGTLLAFTTVAVSILILRYVPPDEVPLPSSLRESIHSVSLIYGFHESNERHAEDATSANNENASAKLPLISKDKSNDQNRRRAASLSIAVVCIGVLVLTSAASAAMLPAPVRLVACFFGGFLLLGGLSTLSWISQDDGRHNFGHSGGFFCPFVPVLPICCILINVYLLVNLGASTLIKVSVWLVIGVFIYLFYGRTHSVLIDAIYVPSAHVDEILINS